MNVTPQIPTTKFDSKIIEVIKHLTAAYENLKLRNKTYGISPEEDFKFQQNSFDEFVRMVCEEHYNRIYNRKGISIVFRDKVKGAFLTDVIVALENSESERLRLLVSELKKLT